MEMNFFNKIRDFKRENGINAEIECFGTEKYKTCESDGDTTECEVIDFCKECYDEMMECPLKTKDSTSLIEALQPSYSKDTIPDVAGRAIELNTVNIDLIKNNEITLITHENKSDKKGNESQERESIDIEISTGDEKKGIQLLQEVKFITAGWSRDFIKVGLKLKTAKSLLNRNFEVKCKAILGFSTDTINNLIRTAERFKDLEFKKIIDKMPYSSLALLSKKSISDNTAQKILDIAEKKADGITFKETQELIKKIKSEEPNNKSTCNDDGEIFSDNKTKKSDQTITHLISHIEKAVQYLKENPTHEITDIDHLIDTIDMAKSIILDVKKIITENSEIKPE
mgnify:CR=1 FL=1